MTSTSSIYFYLSTDIYYNAKFYNLHDEKALYVAFTNSVVILHCTTLILVWLLEWSATNTITSNHLPNKNLSYKLTSQPDCLAFSQLTNFNSELLAIHFLFYANDSKYNFFVFHMVLFSLMRIFVMQLVLLGLQITLEIFFSISAVSKASNTQKLISQISSYISDIGYKMLISIAVSQCK